MLSAFQFGRATLFVIGQSQSQCVHAETVEDAACFDVTIGLSVPRRQHHDGRASLVLALATRSKQASVYGIVFLRRCMNGAGPGQMFAGKLVIIYVRQSEEFLTLSLRSLRVLAKDSA